MSFMHSNDLSSQSEKNLPVVNSRLVINKLVNEFGIAEPDIEVPLETQEKSRLKSAYCNQRLVVRAPSSHETQDLEYQTVTLDVESLEMLDLLELKLLESSALFFRHKTSNRLFSDVLGSLSLKVTPELHLNFKVRRRGNVPCGICKAGS